jgi:LysM repeat protein
MECYACDQEATQRCARCGNSYCADHGEEGPVQCDECLDPINAAPSSVVFRTSFLALLAASVLALWLLVRPPSLPGESSGAIRPLPTTPPIATAGPSQTPAASPGASETPAPTAEATPEPVSTEPIRYTMKDGDTISAVAEDYGLSYLDLLAFNDLTDEEASLLQPGDEILIPK